MLKQRQQSSTSYPVQLFLCQSNDHNTGLAGATPTVTASKNGAAFGAVSGAVTETANGWYSWAGNATDRATLGDLAVHVTATNGDPLDFTVTIVPWDPFDAVRLGLTALPNAAAEASGGLYTRGSGAGQINQAANGQVDANTVKVGGTSQTARDLGTSVLLSSGTGTGQLDFTSGVIKANLAQILGTALTETAGLLAGGFKKLFNVASPTGTLNSIPDAVPGAAGGVFIAGSNAATTANITGSLSGSVGSVSGAVGSVTGAVGSVTGNVGGNVVGSVASVTTVSSGAITAASFAAGAIDAAAIATDAIGSAELAASAVTEIQSGLALASALTTAQADLDDIQTRLPAALVSGRIDASVGAMAADTLTAAAIATDAFGALELAAGAASEIASAVRTELTTELGRVDVATSTRLAGASYTAPDNTTISAIAGYVDTEVAAIKAKTDNLPASPAAIGDIPTANANADALLDRTAGVETSRTVRQAMRLMLAALAGKLSGAEGLTVTIRDTNDSKDRITSTVTADGNRTSVTLDAS